MRALLAGAGVLNLKPTHPPSRGGRCAEEEQVFRRPLRQWLASAREERQGSVARRVPRTKRGAPAAAVDASHPSL